MHALSMHLRGPVAHGAPAEKVPGGVQRCGALAGLHGTDRRVPEVALQCKHHLSTSSLLGHPPWEVLTYRAVQITAN